MAAAAKRRQRHATYGNVAYDTSRFRVGGGAAVRSRQSYLQELPLVRPRRKSQQQVQTRVKVNLRPKEAYSFLPAVGFLAAAFMAILIVFSYGQLTTIYADTATARDDLVALQQEESDLRAQYERVFDQAVLSAAVENAEQSGVLLTTVRADQIVYLDLSEPDNAVVYSEETSGDLLENLRVFWETLTGA